tara:strand:+ start:112 stop:1287 length:1176 start_codon:yes stop_codon:yes gene_type:complete
VKHNTNDSTKDRIENLNENGLFLYMIGHAPDAHYLDRLLNQVGPILGGLSFVNTDDETDCFEVLKKHQSYNGLQFFYENYVFADRAKFDFSLVRNMALKNAQKTWPNQWYFWLDCDDTIEDPERIIDLLTKHPGGEAYGLPYNVGPRATNLFKVRIHRGEKWHWANKVHEELTQGPGEQSKVTVFRDVEVVHAPDDFKSNHDFHISLLLDSVKNAPNEIAYLGKEYFNKGDHESALPWLQKASALAANEFEAYNLQILTGISLFNTNSEDLAIEEFEKAKKNRPWRREAYFYLAEILGKQGGEKNLKLGFANICSGNAQPDMQEPLQHGEVYISLGWKLQASYLKTFNRFAAAHEALQNIPQEMWDEGTQSLFAEIEKGMKEQALKEREAI